MPGRTFTGAGDYNAQLAAWLPVANGRMLRRTGERPALRVAADTAAMGSLPPVAPVTGTSSRVRLGRDYYVRIVGNGYSVDPAMICRFVDVRAGIEQISVTCAGVLVAVRARCWAARQTITDPAHVVIAAALRSVFKARTAALCPALVRLGLRALADYDEIFA